ncbi:hypothetical protein BASA81_001831 [Batrachochytrium salamandrivorans]|nr:hypothetical protein BASA81_001831 [Batrachochytrium salamandrivorans]
MEQTYQPPTGLASVDFESRRGKYFDFANKTLVASAPLVMAQTSKQNEKQTSAATKNAGPGWFDMVSPEVTPEVQRDLTMIRLRQYFDPKHNWKRDDFAGKKVPDHFQIGTVVAGLGERTLKKRERYDTITAEVLANESIREVAKKAYDQVATKRQSGGKRDYARKQNQKRSRFNKQRFV